MNKNDNLAINTLRVVSSEMITKAKSGHPGICLGSAPIVHTLFTNYLNLNPQVVDWPNRDRFVLSAGHGSAMLYTLLHLCGFDVSVDDLKAFRQKGSKTPGHPEYLHTPGVEVTTGPLGQGLATAVGFAIAEKYLANKYNKEDCTLFDYKTFVLCGDGDLQEGLALEACSIAGTLGLDNLIILFDSNDIQLDGPTYKATKDNIKMKFEAMNFTYDFVDSGNDIDSVNKAILKALNNDKPTLIEIKTIIGYGAETAGTSAVHGKPLTEEQLAKLKDNLGFSYPSFTVPNEVYELYENTVIKRGQDKYSKYLANMSYYKEHYNDLYLELNSILNKDFKYDLKDCPLFTDKISTRKVAGKLVTYFSEQNKAILAGSADLASSTMIKGNDGDFSKDNYSARNICYGVREHAMGSITNGLVLSNLRGISAGFFVFSDYLKDSIREAAIMHIPSLFIFSHDSVCVGEDGPTHQPIEQLAGLRAIPNLNVVRPADAKETTFAIIEALGNNVYPTVITTSRQDVPVLEETNDNFTKGAYIVYEPSKVDYILLSCGTELSLCLEAAHKLALENINCRVVSMPSMFKFNRQSKVYQDKILPKGIKTLAVEMGSTMPWYRYADVVLGIDTFGESMPIKDVYERFGFTVSNICKMVKEM